MLRRLLCISLLGNAFYAQSIMHNSDPHRAVQFLLTDWSILQLREPRTDLPCKVTSVQPQLRFDFRFRSGYTVTFDMSEFEGLDDVLTIIVRVIPAAPNTTPVYFSQRLSVPAVDPGATGIVSLNGWFDIGQGAYQVDWLMRDRAEHVCAAFWKISASLTRRQTNVGLELSTGSVTETQGFQEELVGEKTERQNPLTARLLVNCMAQFGVASRLGPEDIERLLSIVRYVVRDPRISHFSIVAFNLAQREIIWSQKAAPPIHLGELRRALESLNVGTVDVKQLSQKDMEADFLMSLIGHELKNTNTNFLLFIGPKADSGFNISKGALKQLARLEYPVFYLNYRLDIFDRQAAPWHDAIGAIVNRWHGRQLTITTPDELCFGWAQIMGMISKSSASTLGSKLSVFEAGPKAESLSPQ